MPIQLNDGIRLAAPRYLDVRKGKFVGGASVPYDSTVEALAGIPITRRAEGLIVYVKNGLVIEQWQFVGGVADVNLVLIFDATGSGGGVQSVTGLNTDNGDPQNPVIYLSSDESTLTGDGTPVNPLQLNQVFTDGTTITGLGTEIDPLVVIGGGGGGPDTNFATDDLTFTGDRVHVLDGNILEIDDSQGALLYMNPVTFETDLVATDGTDFAQITLSGNSVSTDVAFNAQAQSGANSVQINGNAFSNNLSFVAGNIHFTGPIQAFDYGSGTVTGTPTQLAAFDASGNIIEVALGGGTDTNFGISDITFTGDRTHDLDSNILEIIQASTPFFTLDPTLDNENAFVAIQNPTSGSTGQFVTASTAIDVYAKIEAIGDSGASTASVTCSGFESAPSINNYRADLHLFNNIIRCQDYGAGAITGTPTKFAAFDASGNVIEVDLSGGADTNFAISNLTLTGDRTHNLNGNLLTIADGLNEYITLNATAFSAGYGSTDGLTSSSGLTTIANGATNAVLAQLVATNTGNAVGISLDAVGNEALYLAGLHTFNGLLRGQLYGTGVITGTPEYLAAFDATGNVIEVALGGGGGGNTIYTGDDDLVSNRTVGLNNFDLRIADAADNNFFYVNSSSTEAFLGSTDGTANGAFYSASSTSGNNIVFQITADDGTNEVSIKGDSLLDQITYDVASNFFTGAVGVGDVAELFRVSDGTNVFIDISPGGFTSDIAASDGIALSSLHLTADSTGTSNFVLSSSNGGGGLVSIEGQPSTGSGVIIYTADTHFYDNGSISAVRDGGSIAISGATDNSYSALIVDILTGGGLKLENLTANNAAIFASNVTGDLVFQLPDRAGTIVAVNDADDFVNDAAAAVGGVPVGAMYHNNGIIRLRRV